jgi:hypothetical protein
LDEDEGGPDVTTPSTHWSEVGDKLDALGTKLKSHFETTGNPGEVSDALQRIKAAFAEAVDSAGNAVRDDAVKADVKEAGRLFVDALSASLAKVSENLRSDAPAQPAPSDSTGPTTPTEPPGPAH